MSKSVKTAVVANLLIVVLECMGAMISFSEHGWGMLQYFTEDSNLLNLVACFIFIVALLKYGGQAEKIEDTDIPSWVYALKYVAACGLMLTFLIVIFVLAPMLDFNYESMLLRGAMLYNHLLCPLLTLGSFLLVDGTPKLTKTVVYCAMIPSGLYAFVTMILNIARVLDGPYPFLRVYEQPIFMSVIWFVVVLGIALLIAIGMRVLHNRLH